MDIHQIQFQFVIGSRVVFPINLGITGKTAFYFHAVGEFRNFLRIQPDMLDPLRPGTYQTHFSFQDIEKLRQLVDPNLPYQGSHRRNPRIPLRSRYGLAGLLCIHDHAAEFADRKYLSVFGTPFLIKKHRTPVI